MPSISATNITALLMLQPPPQRAEKPTTNSLIATTHGLADGKGAGFGKPTTAAQARINEAMFGVNADDPTATKVKLIERVGKAFGIEQKDYTSLSAYGWAIRNAMEEIKRQAGSAFAFAGIEKDLGLDKLGISLEAVVNAIIDPESDDGKALDAALHRQAGENARGKDNRSAGNGEAKANDAKAAAYRAW